MLRTALGFLVAPLAVPIGIFLFGLPTEVSNVAAILEFLPWGMIWYVFALMFTLVLALPLYLLLNRFELVHWWVSLIAGLLVGGVAALFTSNGQGAQFYILHVVLGGISGLVFWLTVKWRSKTGAHSNAA